MPGKALDEVPRFNPAAFTRVRKLRRFSRDDVGRPASISRHVIAGWEKGETPPSARDLRATAHVLMVRPLVLLHATEGELTLSDLRMNLVLTLEELAHLSSTDRNRLALWESTGRLGTDDEHPLLLAALLGLNYDAAVDYARSGRIPATLTHRFARFLHVTPEAIQQAFDHTAAVSAAAELRIAS